MPTDIRWPPDAPPGNAETRIVDPDVPAGPIWPSTGSTYEELQGRDGDPGVGVPAGGTTGQILSKIDGTDHNTEWVDPSATAGPQGPAGPTGATGATGATGPQGPQGLPGADGSDGSPGATGPAGPQGIQGDPGADGATGPTGPAGATGATGPAGPGVPTGGSAGQLLAKIDGVNYNTQWIPNEFVTKNTAQSITVRKRFWNSAPQINAAGNSSTLEVFQSVAGDDAFMAFHIAGAFASYLGIDGALNDLVYGGWTLGNNTYRVLHENNLGAVDSNSPGASPNLSSVRNLNLRNYVYNPGTGSNYTPTRGDHAGHVWQNWNQTWTIDLTHSSWRPGDVIEFINSRDTGVITVNATLIWLPDGTNDTQVFLNATAGSFRLIKYDTTPGNWMLG